MNPIPIMDFMAKHTSPGSCTCGQCIAAPDEERVPEGHVVDTMFMKVALTNQDDADKETLRKELKSLVEPLGILNGSSHGYITVGGILGDQGTALVLFALGDLLGLWNLITPLTLEPELTSGQALAKAQMGHVGMISVPGGGKIADLEEILHPLLTPMRLQNN